MHGHPPRPTVRMLRPCRHCTGICLFSRAHFPLAFKTSLEQLLELLHVPSQSPTAAAAVQTAVQTSVQTALSHLVLNVPRPVAGGPEVRFQLAAGLPALHVGLAPPDQPSATDYSLTPLLRSLSPERLVRLLAYVMLEYQVGRAPCTVYLVPCTLYLVPCALCRVPCAACRVPCALYRGPCTGFLVPCDV